MNRSEAREILMQLFFQMDAQNDWSEEGAKPFMNEYMAESDQMDYFQAVKKAYVDNQEAVNAKIAEYAQGWSLERLAKVDLAILRLSITEICFMKDAPKKIQVPIGASINEAVNLAKRYGLDNSHKFVNGILGKIARAK